MNQDGPWQVNQLRVENFRCFAELEIDFHRSLTVLVGVNGAGKTAVLDAIAIMLSTVLREFEGPTRGFLLSDVRESVESLDSEEAVANGHRVFPVQAEINCDMSVPWTDGVFPARKIASEFYWSRRRTSTKGRTTWAERNNPVGQEAADLWARANEPGNKEDLPVIALYGVERLNVVRQARGSISPNRSGAYDSALDGKSDLTRLSQLIKDLSWAVFQANGRGDAGAAAREQLAAITLACNSLLGTTGWRDPEWNPLRKEVTLTHPDQGTLPLSQLSAGIKIVAGLVIDLVSRMARANPSKGGDELLKTVPGIVLIDEIDLHLHPSWQQRILPGLRETFPLVQFIVTTHSPQVLSSVDAECIRVIDGSEVRRVDYAAGLRTDIVLEQILGTKPEPSLPINEMLNEYLRLVDGGQGLSDQALKLRKEIDEQLGGVANVPRLAYADVSIAFYDEGP